MKKKVLCGILISILIGGGFLFFYVQTERGKKEAKHQEEVRKKEKKAEIEKAFSPFVKVTRESKVYQKKKGAYQEIGTVYEGTSLSLEQEKITSDTKYFHVKGYDFYIPYTAVSKSEEQVVDTRYKRYLPQEEVTLKEGTILYENNVPRLSLHQQITGVVYKRQNNESYVAYQGQLFGVKDADVLTRKELPTLEKAEEVPVLVYHFIYLNGESCNESICFHEDQIRSHFSYLQQTNAFTINTTELKEFIKGEIVLPKKSVLITIDDGARAEKFLPFLEQYQVNATLFLITSWYDKAPFVSPYMEIASHGHDLHNPGVCPGGQGGGIKCLSEEVLQNDFKLTREKLDGTTAFCYPFYEYNNYAIEQLKKAGFEIAFRGGMTKVKKGTDLFRVPRISLNNTTTQEEVKQIVEG